MKILFIVEYWVPYPLALSGGVAVVIAEDEEECLKLLVEQSGADFAEYNDLILPAIIASDFFPVPGDEQSRIVYSFYT